ncbi:hypothetical protein N0V83_002053 [Neocucurbitaria cava]|uniref:Heterokaryon incompatibility domain-containing protein n=1 Tax=Neocucurbitaria cava TaxID=798079 RepID=A0A9W8YE26_9PLEO|nr:hypothetical protein N0V83_002053 [Neocucurbitaria cava]
MEKGLDMQTLPKVFKDVIFFAKVLCIEYLWIDALCIIQDDARDLETEISNMGDIYRNAVLNVGSIAVASTQADTHPHILSNTSSDEQSDGESSTASLDSPHFLSEDPVGLARAFQVYLKDDYYAGLWGKDMLRGLLWYRDVYHHFDYLDIYPSEYRGHDQYEWYDSGYTEEGVRSVNGAYYFLMAYRDLEIEDEGRSGSVLGLIVEPVDSGQTEYCRIGAFDHKWRYAETEDDSIKPEDYPEFVGWNPDDYERHTITIFSSLITSLYPATRRSRRNLDHMTCSMEASRQFYQYKKRVLK